MNPQPLALEGPPASDSITPWDHVLAALDEIIDVHVLDPWPTPSNYDGRAQVAGVPIQFDPYGDPTPDRQTPIEDVARAIVEALALLTAALDQKADQVVPLIPPRSRYGDACNALVLADGYHIALSGSWIKQTRRYRVAIEAVFAPKLIIPGRP